MTTNNVQALAVGAPQQQMPSTSQNAASPPSKRDLASWWKTFKKNARREEEKGELTIYFVHHSMVRKPQAAGARSRETPLVDCEPSHQARQ